MKHLAMVCLLSLGLFSCSQGFAVGAVKCPALSDVNCTTNNGELFCSVSDGSHFVVVNQYVTYQGHHNLIHPKYLDAQLIGSGQKDAGHVICNYRYFDANFGPEIVMKAISRGKVSSQELTGNGWVQQGKFGAQCNSGKTSDDCEFNM